MSSNVKVGLVAGVIALVLLVGFGLWLGFGYHGQPALTKADLENAVANAVAKASQPTDSLADCLAKAAKLQDEKVQSEAANKCLGQYGAAQPSVPTGAAAAPGQAVATPTGGPALASSKDASVKASNKGTIVNVEQNPTFVIGSPGASSPTQPTMKKQKKGIGWGEAIVLGAIGYAWGKVIEGALSGPPPLNPEARRPQPAPPPVATPAAGMPCGFSTSLTSTDPLITYSPLAASNGQVKLGVQGGGGQICILWFDNLEPNRGRVSNQVLACHVSGNGTVTCPTGGAPRTYFNILVREGDGLLHWGLVPGGQYCGLRVNSQFAISCRADGAAAYQLLDP